MDNKLTIVDYKSTFRKKSSSQIEEHFQQLAAYSLAHDFLYGTSISNLMLVIATRGSHKCEIICADIDDIKHYKDLWNSKLNFYKDAVNG